MLQTMMDPGTSLPVIPLHESQVTAARLTGGNSFRSLHMYALCTLYTGRIKVAEDDIAFKLAIFKKSLHLNDNTCFCSIIQASKLVFGSLLAKNSFFVQFWTKKFASSGMVDCGSGLPAEWPFRNQNAIEASDSPLPGGLWVQRLITHALCCLAYSDIAWCKLFLILTMKGLY